MKQTRWEKRLLDSAALKLQVKRMIKDKLSYADIAAKVGVTKQRVGQILKELA